ncbi:MAG: serine/threonine-protein kinase [Dokdonella sp.]|uniref:serine/threonine-protein kinase n=1 Tax=Dokdonella sp. TaxID=2291710 RepID=UPI00326443F2
MQADDWQRVRALFDVLVDQPPETWEAALDERGVEDPQLRAEILALLRADSGDVVRTVVDAQVPDVLSAFHDREIRVESEKLHGRKVGPFRLVEEIGRGGMGTVWRAERVEGGFEQIVAIKLIRAGWDAQELIGRFRAERQILAHLNHPNIAHLVDGGLTDTGLPWLALEHVDGTDLRSYCDEHDLGIHARLQLFLTVCAAVSHAHAHLVVHRDLKPSNLMVNRRGDVKLLDFGIAKLVDPVASHASLQRVFTPEYAAPEQVRGEAVTTAVDVYALGLLLYELLTGRRPYKVKDSTPAAYERAILDQEPTRPSLAFGNDGDPGDVVIRTAGREVSAQQLRHELRGDLDSIILKALRKAPEQRYASVADLALDIENHLHSRPVAARRGGWRYRSSRFLRRHALAALLGFIAIAALVVGLATALVQANEARLQRDVARTESDKSRQTVEFLLDIFRSADPAATKGEKITAEALLKSGAERAEHYRFKDPAVHFDLLMAMGEAYLGIGASKESFGLFERALDVQTTALPDAHGKRVHALTLLARSQGGLDDFKDAALKLDEAARLLPADAAESELAADLAVTRGINRMSQGEITGAIDDMARGTALFLTLRGAADDTTASSAITLSWAYDDQDRHAEARVLLEPIVSALRASDATNPVRLADALDALANTYETSAEAAAASQMRKEALAITRRVYGNTHGYVGIRLNNLSFSLMRSHDYAGANAAMKEAFDLRRSLEPPGSRKLGTSLNNLASTEYALGHWAEAELIWTEALDIRRKGADATDTAFTLTGLAGAQREQGNLKGARRNIDEAVAVLRAHPSPKPTHLARTLIEQVEVDLALNTVACADAEEAVALMAKNVSADDPQRLYVNAVAAGCALRSVDNATTRQRVVDAQNAMHAEYPADAAHLKQALRYAVTNS